MPIFKIGILIIFFLVNVALAQKDANTFRKKKTVSHFMNALIYCSIVAVPWYFFRDWWLVGALLFERLLVFNIALSVFRKLPWDYVSPKPKSIIDRAAKFVFGKNGAVMYAVYLAIFLLLICKIFIW